MSWADEYYRRVRPVVGNVLFERKLAIWDLGQGYLAAEALARTGLRRQIWFDGGDASGALCRSLGWEHAGRPRAEALASVCRAHNTYETDWDLRSEPPTLEALRRSVREERPDLLLIGAAAGVPAGEVAREAVAAGIPFVLTLVPRAAGVGCVHAAWIPGTAADPAQVVSACEDLARVPSLDLDAPENHLDGLEARSLSLALAKWILLRGRTARPDLERPLVAEGRILLLRGRPDWPWAVRFEEPRPGVVARLSEGGSRYRPPLSLLRDARLVVLGLGTGSLFCAEAGSYFPHLVFVDSKEVTPVNPVRQIYGTRHVGRPKAEVLTEILAQRLDPGGAWASVSEGALHTHRSATRSLSWASLHLRGSDATAMQRWSEILDRTQPKMVVVAMGRTKDDNFAATEELRRRGIPHVTPSAFPGVTHFKHILTDGASGPCYDCLQGHLAVDSGPGPALTPEERDLFYGGSQPATLAETYPSAHSLLRLATDLTLPRAARPAYLLRELGAERSCFVGANRAERSGEGWLYGAAEPFTMVTYGVEDVIGSTVRGRCSCGRTLG
jgi:hypothetical protein